MQEIEQQQQEDPVRPIGSDQGSQDIQQHQSDDGAGRTIVGNNSGVDRKKEVDRTSIVNLMHRQWR